MFQQLVDVAQHGTTGLARELRLDPGHLNGQRRAQGDAIDGAALKAPKLIGGAELTAEHDDGNALRDRVVRQPEAQRLAVGARQVTVQQDQVGRRRFGHACDVEPAGGDGLQGAERLQRLRQRRLGRWWFAEQQDGRLEGQVNVHVRPS